MNTRHWIGAVAFLLYAVFAVGIVPAAFAQESALPQNDDVLAAQAAGEKTAQNAAVNKQGASESSMATVTATSAQVQDEAKSANVLDPDSAVSAAPNTVPALAAQANSEPQTPSATSEDADAGAPTQSSEEDAALRAMAPSAPETVAGNQAQLTDKQTTTETVTTETQDMHRLYNPNSGEHFYTANTDERDHLAELGWSYEGVGWTAPVSSDFPVYRLYNPNAGDHHYTLNEAERDNLASVGWNYEGIGWYSAASSVGVPVLRQYNPNAVAGAHNFTLDSSENAYLVDVGWSFESIAWYSLTSTTETVEHTTSKVTATAPYLKATFSAGSGEVTETIVSYAKDDVTYLFFPSYAPLNSVYLSAFDAQGAEVRIFVSNNGSYTLNDSSTATNLTSLGGTVDANGSIYLSFMTLSMDGNFPLVVMKSANIPAVYINSADLSSRGRGFVEASKDHSAKAKAAVYMVDENGGIVYNADDLSNSKALSTIKGRGNSTWQNGIKKPYQISLSTKAELVDGAGKAKKWILLANSADATLLNSSIVFDAATELGLATIDSTPVDLYYDGEYRGSYLLAEKIEIGKDRVDIVDLEDALEEANPNVDLDALPTALGTNRFGNQLQYARGVTDPADITGGYLIELDEGYYGTEKCWFTIVWPGTNTTSHFVVKSPEVASYNAIKYISEAMQEALNNLAENKANLSDGSFSFDLDSFAKMYLIEEFFKNIDSYVSSTYFYLDAKSTTIMSGPVWDFDSCMGTRKDASDSMQNSYSGIYLSITNNGVFSDVVRNRMKQVYYDTFNILMRDVVLGSSSAIAPAGRLHSVIWYANRISSSQAMNEIPFGVTAFDFQVEPYETWSLNVERLAYWLVWRTSWMNTNYVNVGESNLTNSLYKYGDFDLGNVYDYEYYLEQNPDVAAKYSDPADVIRHFIVHGMREGAQGSRNFNVYAYRENNPKLNELFGDNLMAYYLHYCTDGYKQGLVCWES